ncbi:MAG: hypothetical protein UW68_C0006G0021 [Candidatus Collierbacteria bacterium GW2011_GWB1_44_6]|uniref:Uncharacterized protein n=2 Tax=Candidatus Collieribacteriota TaxID=1752725 RepID=A0A0G1MNH9_9BACT|nr:MAG: hypothetical protein UV68_C0023G0015 [Candidatus Collierbacteria bacterium GW2011_GWC2_43_12]KKT73579.1 MAG: hypothetical protein UW68_C0006G0021 [Candidatus Collierbacteria bacterium GW2011_GWB1_44_6]KKT83256.1 MAG: hypothetical protein UW80_C0018G0007 [Microgenomates group bacterium GW2011_GWC1_44_9]
MYLTIINPSTEERVELEDDETASIFSGQAQVRLTSGGPELRLTGKKLPKILSVQTELGADNPNCFIFRDWQPLLGSDISLVIYDQGERRLEVRLELKESPFD